MSQDEHRVEPSDEPGGYGTPTPEQELPGQGTQGETPERPAQDEPTVPEGEFPTPKDPDAAPPPSAIGDPTGGAGGQ